MKDTKNGLLLSTEAVWIEEPPNVITPIVTAEISIQWWEKKMFPVKNKNEGHKYS